MTLAVRTVRLDDERPLLELCPVDEPVAWLRAGDGLVGWGIAARLEPLPGENRFSSLDCQLRALAADAVVDDEVGLPGTGLVGLGSFSFSADTPGSVLIVPRVIVGRRHGTTWLTTIDPPDGRGVSPLAQTPSSARPAGRDRPRYAGSSMPDVHWLEAVATAVGRIAAGEAHKVVLARDVALWSRELFDPTDLARRLTIRFPDCHTFIVEGLVGATPELLVDRFGDDIHARVLAGTVGRAEDRDADAALGAGLLASTKDQWEHRLAVESVRDVLAPLCARLDTDDAPRLLRLDNVQHLATQVRGRLLERRSGLELAGALHPTAAVGGTPRDAALQMIRELEGLERGRYAAPVGWTDPEGDGEWGIALRCAEISGARARLFAGVGIVAGSLPEEELEETRLKLLAMQTALDPSAAVR